MLTVSPVRSVVVVNRNGAWWVLVAVMDTGAIGFSPVAALTGKQSIETGLLRWAVPWKVSPMRALISNDGHWTELDADAVVQPKRVRRTGIFARWQTTVAVGHWCLRAFRVAAGYAIVSACRDGLDGREAIVLRASGTAPGAQETEVVLMQRLLDRLPLGRILVLLLALLCAAPSPRAELVSPRPHLRLQLMWYHQSQFAGYYVAEFEHYFRQEGIDVDLLEGGADIDPLQRLQRGEVEVALSWLDNAMAADSKGARLINVAQIFSGSGQQLICRFSAGIHSLADVAGKKVGISWPGDRVTVSAMLRAAGVDAAGVTWVKRSAHGEDLVDGTVPCISGVSYNEPWWVVDAGVPEMDLVTFSPGDYGLAHVEEGLYVREQSLESPEFRNALVKLLRAVKRGWAYAKAEPVPTSNIVRLFGSDPSKNSSFPKAMLDSVIPLLPDNFDNFGVLDIDAYDRMVAALPYSQSVRVKRSPLWTHSVIRQLRASEQSATVLTDATQQYLRMTVGSTLFLVFVYAGIWIFAFAGGLMGIEAGYNLIGRIALGALSCMGGGVLRDLLLGGDRLPFPWLASPGLPIGVLAVVLMASLWAALLSEKTASPAFQVTKRTAETVGYAALSVLGAVAPLAMGLPWLWAPFCAWLTCSGGGVLRDILTGREPRSFRAKLFDEAAIVGGVWLVAFLVFSNHFEHNRWLVTVGLVTTGLLVGALRQYWGRREVWYPNWLHHR